MIYDARRYGIIQGILYLLNVIAHNDKSHQFVGFPIEPMK